MTRMTLITYGIVGLMALSAGAAGAQTKTIEGETRVVTATIEAIEKASRQITIKKADGTYDMLYVGEPLKQFDALKVGDKITARYYENMVLQVKPAGQPDVNTGGTKMVASETSMAGTASHQRTITATISAIDQQLPSITFTGPGDWTYTTRVKDREALAKVKVGDKVDITWTEALVLSID